MVQRKKSEQLAAAADRSQILALSQALEAEDQLAAMKLRQEMMKMEQASSDRKIKGLSQLLKIAGQTEAKREQAREQGKTPPPGVQDIFPEQPVQPDNVQPGQIMTLPAGMTPEQAASGGRAVQQGQAGGGGVPPFIAQQQVTQGQQIIPGQFFDRAVPTTTRQTTITPNVLTAFQAEQLARSSPPSLFFQHIKNMPDLKLGGEALAVSERVFQATGDLGMAITVGDRLQRGTPKTATQAELQSFRESYYRRSNEFISQQKAANEIFVFLSAGSNLGDYSAITKYVKLLDPIGVIRGSEVDSVAIQQPKKDVLETMLRQWIGTGRLTDEMRLELGRLVAADIGVATREQDRTLGNDRFVAERRGLAPEELPDLVDRRFRLVQGAAESGLTFQGKFTSTGLPFVVDPNTGKVQVWEE